MSFPAPTSAADGKDNKKEVSELFERMKTSYDVDTRRRLIGSVARSECAAAPRDFPHSVCCRYDDLHGVAAVAIGASKASKVLCVGCGTGQELITLAQVHRASSAPAKWSLVGVDPSEPMLAVAKQRFAQELTPEQSARVELVQAYLSAVSIEEKYTGFDAATSLLVSSIFLALRI
jgi:SAM-dependent methyltransferase